MQGNIDEKIARELPLILTIQVRIQSHWLSKYLNGMIIYKVEY